VREHYVAIGTSGGGMVCRTIGAGSAVVVLGQDPSGGDALGYEVDDYT
jgi:hypothetical protein